ncbi:acyltransferase family protein [Sodalis sp. RH20]|uniref:acyltransferase family protein n=1 Tax=unclassified Sodalis (in: enterobacteria) TaxID=2636512 RepID=UPI0039B51E67
MLGIIRFFLASSVILFHLSAKFPDLGLYAVNCFYVISGYLITLILNRTYKFEFAPFALNRFLRLFPTYWFASITSIVIIYFANNPTTFHPSYGLHFSFKEIISNIFMIPWAFVSDNIIISPFQTFTTPEFLNFNGYMFRAVTSSWSVAVEIVCYFFLWLFVAKGPKRACLIIIVSSMYHWYSLHHNESTIATYSPFLAAMLPFSIGSLGYFISAFIEKIRPNIGKEFRHQIAYLLIFIAAFLINWLIGWLEGKTLASLYYYFNNVIALFAVISLHATKLPDRFKNSGKFFGDMSYPIFLCQFFFGLVAWSILGEPEKTRGWYIFFIGYSFSLLFGYISILLIDRPISKIRDKIRP